MSANDPKRTFEWALVGQCSLMRCAAPERLQTSCVFEVPALQCGVDDAAGEPCHDPFLRWRDRRTRRREDRANRGRRRGAKRCLTRWPPTAPSSSWASLLSAFIPTDRTTVSICNQYISFWKRMKIALSVISCTVELRYRGTRRSSNFKASVLCR